MKNFAVLLFIVFVHHSAHAQVKIGGDPASIESSALLELESTDKALILTRVANTSAILNPVDGMLVYDMSQSCIVSRINSVWSGCLDAGSGSAGSVSSLDCPGVVFSPSTMTSGVTYTGTATIGFSGANGGTYSSYSVASTGVTGLSANLVAGGLPNGGGSLVLSVSGTPVGVGSANFLFSFGGQSCTFTNFTVGFDAIAAELTTSLAAYDAAFSGNWVAISKTEYDKLANNLVSVNRFGTLEGAMLTGPFANLYASTYTFGQNVNPSPANSYIFAFKIASDDAIDGANDVVRLSSLTTGSGFNIYGGNSLPDNIPMMFQQHYVLKAANTLHVDPMYLGCSTNNTRPIYYRAAGTTGKYRVGSVSTVLSIGNGWSMQGLSTTVRQW